MSECYCCSCEKIPVTNQKTTHEILIIDPACRSHGAHGKRECVTHKNGPEACTWGDGCGMTLDNVIEGKH